MWAANYPGDYQWQLLHVAVERGGQNVGTDQPDLILTGIGISEAVCAALNRQINGDATIGSFTMPTGNGYGYSSLGAIRASGLEAPAAVPSSNIKYVLSQEGCVTGSGFYYLHYILEAN